MMIETITANPWFSLTSFTVTAASLVAAFIFYRKSRREKLPRYSVISQSVIENSLPFHPGLCVSFHGIEQKLITVAKVAFWNDGTETIARADIAQAKPLSIVLEAGFDVLNASVLRSTDAANQFEIAEPGKKKDGCVSIPIGFDFLDHGDGALVQVVHNGHVRTKVWVEGRIKGSRDIQRLNPLMTHQEIVMSTERILSSRRAFVAYLFAFLVLGLALVIGGFYAPTFRIDIAIGASLIFLALISVLALISGRKVPVAISTIDEMVPDKNVDSDNH